MGEQMPEVQNVPGEGVSEASVDDWGMENPEHEFSAAFAQDRYLFIVNWTTGSEGVWFKVVKRKSGEEVVSFSWDKKQTWGICTPECDCDVSPDGVSLTTYRSR
jgi:hypothetical protein